MATEIGTGVALLPPNALIAVEIWFGAELGPVEGDRTIRVEPTVWWLSAPLSGAAALIRRLEDEVGERGAVTDISGAFSGRALLIFPQATSLELIRAVVDEQLSVDEAAEMEEEALAETGNIILNGCLGTMANMLRQTLTMTLPAVSRGKGGAFFHLDGDPQADGLVLFLYINFSVLGRNIRGYIAMVLDMPSLAALKLLVQQFIESVMSDDADAV